MMNLKNVLLALVAGLVLSLSAQASVVYNVKVNTSGLAGTNGWLDFGLIGLADSPLAQASLTGLSGGTALGGDVLDGDASAVTGGWSLGNTTGFNAVLAGWQFGQELMFQLTFSGNWETSALGSGTTFAFKLWDAAISNTLLTDDLEGNLFRVDLWPNGVTSVSTFKNGNAPSALIEQAAAVPEPASLVLLLAGLLALLTLRRRKSA